MVSPSIKIIYYTVNNYCTFEFRTSWTALYRDEPRYTGMPAARVSTDVPVVWWFKLKKNKKKKSYRLSQTRRATTTTGVPGNGCRFRAKRCVHTTVYHRELDFHKSNLQVEKVLLARGSTFISARVISEKWIVDSDEHQRIYIHTRTPRVYI